MKKNQGVVCRLLSFMLAFAMLVGMLPAMGEPAVAAEPAVFVYNLHKLQYGQWGANGYGPDSVRSYYVTMKGNSQELSTYAGAKTGPFGTTDTTPFYFYNKSEGATYVWGDQAYGWILIGQGNWASTAVLVPNSGTYQLSYNAGLYSTGGTVRVYFAPMSASNHRAEEYYVGTVDTASATSNWDVLTDLGEVTVDAGEYVLTTEIVSTGNFAGGSFQLTSEDALRTMTVSVADGATLTLNRRETNSFKIDTLIDGASVSAANATEVHVEAVDPSIVTASVSNGKLNLYGLVAGSTTVNLRVVVDGVMGWAEIPVTISEEIDASGYSMDFGLGQYDVGVGGSREGVVKLLYDGEEISLSGVTNYGAISNNSDVLDAELSLIDEELHLTVLGLSEGTANLTVAMTADGKTHSMSVPITVSQKTLQYNFLRLQYGELSTDGVSPSYVTDWSVLGGLENQKNHITNAFRFHEQSYSSTWLWGARSAEYGPEFTGKAADYGAYQIRLDETGVFTPALTYFAHPSGSKFEVYLAPSDVENWMTESYLIGVVDTYASEEMPEQVASFDEISLSSGDYIFGFRIIGSSKSKIQYISKFELRMKGSPWVASRSEMPAVISLNSSVNVYLNSTFGGVEVPFADAEVAVENSEIVKASITADGVSSSAKLTLQGVGVGQTNVTISMQYNGVYCKRVVPIQVQTGATADEDYYYNFKKLYYGPYSTSAYSPSTITSFDMTTKGDVNEINPQTESDPWMYGGDGGAISEVGWNSSSRDFGIYLYGTAGAWTAYKVRVSEGGIFTPIVGYMQWVWGGDVSIYFAPADAKYPRSERYLLGQVSTYAAEATYPLYLTGEQQYLPAGDYILSYVVTDDTRGGIFSDGLRLDVAENDYLHVSAILPESILQGTVTTIPLNAFYNREVIDFSRVDSVSVVSDKTSCVAASIVESNGEAQLVLEAAASGLCNLTISAEKGDLESEITLPISVVGLGSRNFTLKKKKLIPNEKTTLDLTATLTDGTVLSLDELLSYDGCSVSFSSLNSAYATVSDDLTVTGVAKGTTAIRATIVFNGKTYTSGAAVQVVDETYSKLAVTVDDATVYVGKPTQLNVSALTQNDVAIGSENLEFTYQTQDGLTVSEAGVLTAQKAGTYWVDVTGTFNGVSLTTGIQIVAVDNAFSELSVSVPRTKMKLGEEGMQLTAAVTGAAGDVLENVEVTYASSSSCVAVSDSGYLTAKALGDATITVTAGALSKQITINVTNNKAASSYYSATKMKNLRENVENLIWAQGTADSAAKAGDLYLDMLDTLYHSMTTQELPRAAAVGVRWDPNMYHCRYCKKDLREAYSNYPWVLDPINHPYKIQCPSCKRYFPSNDFESFYKSGIDANGNWSYELAKQNGSAYLTNTLYPEMGTGWGVDDGYGYRTGKTIKLEISSGNAAKYGSTHEEIHTYISYYNHWGTWYGSGNSSMYGLIQTAVNRLTNAYLYTGDAKYGRIGAILVSRFADIYPDMEIAPYFPWHFNSDGTTPKGKIVGKIWEHGLSRTFTLGYDAFYDLYDDPEVISYLSQKATLYGQSNPKNTGNLIREHIEENLLRENVRSVKNGNINGNFGMHQSLMAYTAVVLDSPTESKEIIDWIFRSSDGSTTDSVVGGNFTAQIMGNVSRDGTGTEAAPNYNNLWIGSVSNIIDALGGYEGYEGSNLFDNPKIIKMYKMHFPLTLTRKSTVAIGDSGATADETFHLPGISALSTAFLNSGDPEIAQMIYFLNGNSTNNLRGNIFESASELRNRIEAVIDEYGEYPFDESMQVSGFGFDILRSGTLTDSADTQQDFWLYYGKTGGHGHPAALNLGMDAYGLNISPDFGYPEAADGGYKNIYWGQASVNHNLVVVDDLRQTSISPNGTPLHFDDAGRVKLTDVRALGAYSATRDYRRAIVSVAVNDEISYGVDFFLVNGGNEHVYSFHALSDTIAETSGNLSFVAQSSGTYAGSSVALGSGTQTNGYNFLYDVRRAANPGSVFSVNFKITDFRGTLTDERDLYLRMTMLNDFELSEVALAKGQPPQRDGNPTELEFVLARRSGSDMLSLFTTVFEPYDTTPYIAKQEQVSITRIGGASEGTYDRAQALKITLTSGRVDYVVFATNRDVTYRVDNLFDFAGSFGVYTLENGVPTYSYINDGTLIGQTKSTAAYTGQIIDFTKTLSFENSLTVSLEQSVSNLDELVGRSIYVTNQGGGNATYVIKGATKLSNGYVKLDLGDVTLIRALASATSNTYTYDVAAGQNFRIPLSTTSDHMPRFETVAKKSVPINKKLQFTVNAVDPDGLALTYAATSLPSGATFDASTRTFTWTPRETQVGVHSATFTVTNGIKTAQMSVGMEVFYNTNVTAVNIINGAQIRLKGIQGLRFISKVSRTLLQELQDNGASEIEYGTILIPAEDITSLDEFVIGAQFGTHKVAVVPAVYQYNITDDWIQYTAVITHIAEKNYRRAYAARPYVKYTDAGGEHVIYGDTRVERSIYQVASAALNDSGRYTEAELEVLRSIVESKLLEFTLTEPAMSVVAGDAVCTSGDAWFTAETVWTRTGGHVFSGEFLDGTDYTATVCLTAKDGYSFQTSVSITVNGKQVDSFEISEDGKICTFEVFYDYSDSGYTGIY